MVLDLGEEGCDPLGILFKVLDSCFLLLLVLHVDVALPGEMQLEEGVVLSADDVFNLSHQFVHEFLHFFLHFALEQDLHLRPVQ